MNKIIVVSTNNNSDYYCYSEYVKKAWNKIGWEVCVFVTSDVNKKEIFADYIIEIPNIDNVRTQTLAQASRLYAANYFKDCIIMTSDMDLIPLSNYWNAENLTVYGHDLTDYTEYPMGYISMTSKQWVEVMKLTGDTIVDMEKDMKEMETPYSDNWAVWWGYDQQLITKRLNEYGKDKINFINRGRRNTGTFAYGRIDRADGMEIPNETLIDMHCENINAKHPDKWNKFINIWQSLF